MREVRKLPFTRQKLWAIELRIHTETRSQCRKRYLSPYRHSSTRTLEAELLLLGPLDKLLGDAVWVFVPVLYIVLLDERIAMLVFEDAPG